METKQEKEEKSKGLLSVYDEGDNEVDAEDKVEAVLTDAMDVSPGVDSSLILTTPVPGSGPDTPAPDPDPGPAAMLFKMSWYSSISSGNTAPKFCVKEDSKL